LASASGARERLRLVLLRAALVRDDDERSALRQRKPSPLAGGKTNSAAQPLLPLPPVVAPALLGTPVSMRGRDVERAPLRLPRDDEPRSACAELLLPPGKPVEELSYELERCSSGLRPRICSGDCAAS
jgi:hypothetical protein